MYRLSLLIITALSLLTGICYGQKNSPLFTRHQLTSDFISEGVAVGDVNRDGKLDILAGAFWFEAPDWKQHALAPATTYHAGTDYSNTFLDYSMDVNQDGWTDLIVVGYPGTPAFWYENPKNKTGYWKKHTVAGDLGVGNESPNFVDVDGDGRVDILCADVGAKQIVWLSAPAGKSDTTWSRHAISGLNAPGTDRYSHGLGFGDINKDGRKDVIIKSGWWEAPENRKQENWTFHPADFGEDCSEMYVLDVNGDGLNDVISASAHQYGIWWHEQVKEGNGTISWRSHEISKSFSETHGVALTDVNGDGNPDIITGKRFFAHNDTNADPGSHEPAVLYWFEYTPHKAPYFIPHQIDDNSGVGLHLVVQDMNGDGKKDLVISNKKGVFYFEHTAVNR